VLSWAALFLEMGRIGSPETSVLNYPTPPIHFKRGGSLISRIIHVLKTIGQNGLSRQEE
jgi:hypothetical protein